MYILLKRLSFIISFILITISQPCYAVLTIEITQGADVGLPIAIVQFNQQGQGKPPHDVAAVIQADLHRSGRFSPLSDKKFLSRPGTDSDIIFKDWRLVKAEALVVGSIKKLTPGHYQVEFRLYDVFKEKQLAGFQYSVDAKLLRATAHQISDIIYQKLTGEPGAFSSRIAYITREQRKYQTIFKLQVADSDGYNPKTIVKSPQPLLSPAWSPDSSRLAYVSFEKHRSMVYIQRLSNGKREKIAEFKGINSAPAWSPDGRRLAMTLSRDGNPEIYIMNLRTRGLKRLTRNYAIDTEPSWSPDGKSIIFTSDRAGQPQIYKMDINGRRVKRLTFEGKYNARASYSADGRSITFVNGSGGRYHIAILYLANNQLQILTEAPLDESPSFAPNGRMVIYATEVRGRGVLASVSADGRVRQLYKAERGDVREPAWSPSNQQLKYKES